MTARLAMIGLLACVLTGCSLAAQPATSPGPTRPPTPTPRPTIGIPSPTPEPTFFLYVVKARDTLTSIARQFRTSALSVSYWNRDQYGSLDPDSSGYDPNRIQAGWQLRLVPGVITDGDYEEIPSPSPSTSPSGKPSASPSPSPSPAPSQSPSPSLSSTAVANKVISHASRTSTHVALTFDMGGRLDPAIDIMDWLIANHVKATIFPTGMMSSSAIGRGVIARAVAHPDLFAIGNHSWDHPHFRGLTASQIADQLNRCESTIRALGGTSTKPFFRPPFGGLNAKVGAAAGAAGWAYTVMWDVDAIDWRPVADGGPTADDLVTKVACQAQGGSIVLMHLGGYNTLEALPRIVAGLHDRGLTPRRLSDWYH